MRKKLYKSKFRLFVLMLVLIGQVSIQAANNNELVMDKFSVHAGDKVSVPVNMHNVDRISGFQFDLYLPSGMDVENVTLVTNRTTATNHYVTYEKQKDGATRIVCMSNNNFVFSGNSGYVLNVILSASRTMSTAEYNVYLKNQELVTPEIGIFHVNQTSTTVSVASDAVRGDANDDGSVDVSDITTIATYILNGKATTWNEKNADVNGDGVIDVSDITGVASIILGKKSLCPDDHHPHAIDMGLPSGTKWACCNVGATTPEGYGGYYAWGETSEKSVYNWDTYAYYNSSTGYRTNIGSDIAGTQYDVAHVRMGGSWRMPSHEQQMELMNNCTLTWTQQNGVNDILVTGKNGGQVFLPAAGNRWSDNLYNVGSHGYYWSSSLYPRYDSDAYVIDFISGDWYWNDYYCRRNGQSVRAVCP